MKQGRRRSGAEGNAGNLKAAFPMAAQRQEDCQGNRGFPVQYEDFDLEKADLQGKRHVGRPMRRGPHTLAIRGFRMKSARLRFLTEGRIRIRDSDRFPGVTP